MNASEEELRSMVRSILAEERKEAMSHPTRREKVTQFTDPEGKKWISRTLSRVDEFKRALALVGSICLALGGAWGIYYDRVILPETTARSAALIEKHATESRKRMDDVMPMIVMRTEFERLEATVSAQDQDIAEIKSAVIIIQADIKELLRRR